MTQSLGIRFRAIKTHCHGCLKIFFRKPSQVRRAKRTFCSLDCRWEFREKDREAKFWKDVYKTSDGCWFWLGEVSKSSGYGRFKYKTVRVSAHRYAYELKYGAIPKGMDVLHHCDTPTCVRWDHLFLGTQQDNANDAKVKGRM